MIEKILYDFLSEETWEESGDSIWEYYEIEKKLVDAVKAADGMCLKFVSPGMDGMPDRLVLMPGGCMAFVETKAPGKKPRLLQRYRHMQLRALGFQVFVVDAPEQIGEVLHAVLPA